MPNNFHPVSSDLKTEGDGLSKEVATRVSADTLGHEDENKRACFVAIALSPMRKMATTLPPHLPPRVEASEIKCFSVG